MLSILNKIIKSFKYRIRRFDPRYVRFLVHSLTHKDVPIVIKLDKKIKVRFWPGDILGKAIWSFELNERAFVNKYLNSGMVVFDIGANMGLYSLIASNIVGPLGKVHSFEPNPRMFKELKYNSALNNVNNIIYNNIALSDSIGKGKLESHGQGREIYGSLHIVDNNYIDLIDIDLWTLDSYIENNGIKHIDLIKIDVEGAEQLVFNGAQKALSKHIPKAIMFEINPKLTLRFGFNRNYIIDFFNNYGYDIFSIGKKGLLSPCRLSKNIQKHTDNYLAKLI